MSTYVMSDIHGCYNELMNMMKKIEFSSKDTLIIAGDYIDRGKQSYEMLKWIENPLENIHLIKGNHDVEFAYSVSLLSETFKQKNMDNQQNLWTAYTCMKQLFAKMDNGSSFFDYYGMIGKLIEEHNVTMRQLVLWAECIDKMPFLYEINVNGKRCIVVHAGYIEDLEHADTEETYETVEDFYLYARDDAYICGGIEHGIIVAGHTPTIKEEEFPYNNGDIFRMYDEEQDCTFFDIDCGCSWREKRKNAKLACIRMEDEKIFYI